MLKIYVNDLSYKDEDGLSEDGAKEHDQILIVDPKVFNPYAYKELVGRKMSGCSIKSNSGSYGFYNNWNKDYFRELRVGEQLNFDISLYWRLELRSNKLLVNSSFGDNSNCVIDMEKKNITLVDSVSKYKEDNPILMKLSNSDKSNGIKVFKSKMGSTLLCNGVNSSKRGILKLDSNTTKSRYDTLCGWRFSDGYDNGWRSDAFDLVKETIYINLPKNAQMIGDKILVSGDKGKRDCVIDLKRGIIHDTNLSNYKKENPIILKFRKKI